jgi:hypothetical protein
VRPTWEYKTIKAGVDSSWLGGKVDETKLEARLNELGRDGWELVVAFDTNMAQGQTRDVVAIFKRDRSI